MQFLNHLKLWQKLLLLVVAMAVPTALLGTFYLSSANHQVSQARNELEGAHYAHSLGAVLAEMENHRGELFALMTCGMAGVAGTVMVIYAGFLAPVIPNALGNILIASVISTPAGLAVAALMVPLWRS